MVDLVDLHEAIVIGAAGGIRVKAAFHIGHGLRQGVGDALGSAEGSGVAVLSRTGSGRVGTALSAALTPTQ